jgi:hypothetical protein
MKNTYNGGYKKHKKENKNMSLAQPTFDTLYYVDHLKKHGFNEQQAEGLLHVQLIAASAQEANMLTKSDLKLSVIKIGSRFDAANSEMKTMWKEIDARFIAIDAKFDAMWKEIDARFIAVDAKFDAMWKEIDARFIAVDAKFDAMWKEIDARFIAIDAKFDGKFDAMWKEIDARFSAVDARIDALDAKIDSAANNLRIDLERHLEKSLHKTTVNMFVLMMGAMAVSTTFTVSLVGLMLHIML